MIIRYDFWKTAHEHGADFSDTQSAFVGHLIGLADDKLADHGPSQVVNTVELALRLLARGIVPIRRHQQQIDDAYSEYVTANDPNDLVGPSGAGDARWISGNQPLGYRILFANAPDASASARTVVVTNPIDPGLDLATLRLGEIDIPGIRVAIPPTFNPAAGLNEVRMNVDLRPSLSLFVNIAAALDQATRVLTWTFASIDPVTGLPPDDPSVVFLPAGKEGGVVFSVRPNQAVLTGTQISDQGNVLIFVSDNGGPFTVWVTRTTDTSETFSGVDGHTYSFYSIARDLAGNTEPTKTAAEATTQVQVTTMRR